jgi:hypothetical protein
MKYINYNIEILFCEPPYFNFPTLINKIIDFLKISFGEWMCLWIIS